MGTLREVGAVDASAAGALTALGHHLAGVVLTTTTCQTDIGA